MRLNVGTLLGIIVLIVLSGSALAQTDAVAERITRVEKGLLPATAATGQAGVGQGLTERMRHYKVPGISVAVINDGKVEWARGYGVIETGGSQPITPTTLFQAGSVSKSVAAMGALWLVEQKRLDLDEDVNKKLTHWKVPENTFTKEQKVTLRRLLSHTAGLTVHGFPGYATDVPIPTLTQVLDGSKPSKTPAIRVDTVPGTLWRYSGGGYTVMQQLVIDVTGKPFPDFMQETVLGKLGMNDSTYAQPLPDAQAARTATGHTADGKKVKGRWHLYPEMAAAGLWTTPTDLARYAIEIQNAAAGKSNAVLSQAMARRMLTVEKDGDGLGVFLAGKGPAQRFSHGGRDEGFDTQWIAYAEAGQGAVIMANNNLNNDFVNELLRSIATEYHWRDYPVQQRVLATVAPAVLKTYAGRYQFGPSLVVTILEREGRLFGQATGQGEVELFPESKTTFFLTVVDAKATFITDATGKVLAIDWKQNGTGTRAKRLP